MQSKSITVIFIYLILFTSQGHGLFTSYWAGSAAYGPSMDVDACRLSVKTAIIVGIPSLIVVVGFTPTGISAHSLASFLMSIAAKYNCGTAGIALLQSLGAKGFTWTGYTGLYLYADKVADIICGCEDKKKP